MPTFTWNLNADGDWDMASNWTPSGRPTSGSSVTKPQRRQRRLRLAGGMLTITGSASFGTELLMQGGTLELGALGAARRGRPFFVDRAGPMRLWLKRLRVKQRMLREGHALRHTSQYF